MQTWNRFTTHLDMEESDKEPEEDKESDWDADIEESADYRARVTMRRPRQPPKSLSSKLSTPKQDGQVELDQWPP